MESPEQTMLRRRTLSCYPLVRGSTLKPMTNLTLASPTLDRLRLFGMQCSLEQELAERKSRGEDVERNHEVEKSKRATPNQFELSEVRSELGVCFPCLVKLFYSSHLSRRRIV